MNFLRRALIEAARRAAADPRVRDKAAQLYRREIKPRADAALAGARPRIEAVREELRAAAREADPRENPAAFAKALKNRVVNGARRSG